MIFALCVLFVFVANFGLSELTPLKHSHKKDVSKKFAGLLRNLVEVNEKRFEAVRQLAKLQDYSFDRHNLRTRYKKSTKNKLRSRNEDQLESAEDHQYTPSSGPYLVLFRQRKSKKRDTTDLSLVSENDHMQPDKSADAKMTGYRLYDTEGPPIARNLKKVLGKKGTKYCRSACKTALRNVCQTHKCKSKMKKRFRSTCKSMCKTFFRAS